MLSRSRKRSAEYLVSSDLSVIFLKEAEQDLEEIRLQLWQVSPMTIPKVLEELRTVKAQLAQFPFFYQVVPTRKLRRALLHSCRRTVYFRLTGDHRNSTAASEASLAFKTWHGWLKSYVF